MSEKKKELVVQETKTELNMETNEATIKNLIYVIRGQQVMLDSDLAILYQVETKVLNQAVKRNLLRFPETFRFQLNKDEFTNLKSQFVTSSSHDDNNYGGRRKLPYVFTEQGIAMLSAVLRSDVAIQVSIKIMNTFVEMRRFMANNSIVLNRINEIEVKQLIYQKNADEKFDQIFTYISEHEEVSQKIFFEGQVYDAFSLLTELIAKAKKEIVLIDNYVDVLTLNILAKKQENVKVQIYTLKKTRLSSMDINNFNQQYPTLGVDYTEEFHDRFIIIDGTLAYHVGASLKDAGKKCFAINRIEDRANILDILNRIKKTDNGGTDDRRE
ncbi:MAG: ORF6N domain-containing protein [Lachnospiraceae bacterium]|nr:ORF6N domain-containing protein [Lachnospiraceae bacterium]